MPTTQVELYHGYKSLDGIIDCWHREESFRVCHEATPSVSVNRNSKKLIVTTL